MRKLTFRYLSNILLLLFTFLFAHPAFAHGDEPRLEISVEKINPGGVVELRGVDFEYDELVSLSLTGSTAQIPLSDVTADEEGVFLQVITLPADLPAGEYNFQATTDDHVVISPTITVWGTASEDQGDGAVWDQSDLELGPVPTLAASAPAPQIAPVSEPEPQPAKYPTVPYVWIAVALGITCVVVLALRLKR